MKKTILSLLLAGIFMISPIISLGAELSLSQATGMVNLLRNIENPKAEDEITKEVETLEEPTPLPDESTIALAAATVAETTDIGWLYENGIWFYRNSSGDLVKGWHKINGLWYYFDLTYNYMYSNGWQYVEASGKRFYFTASGDAYTGWKEDNQYGAKYYFYEGLYATDWVSENGNWYYIKDGKMITNEYNYKVNGVSYGFQSNGVMMKGWNQVTYTSAGGTVDTDWYYYVSSGAAENGWFQYNNAWYYLYDGWMADDGVREIGTDKVVYAFDTDGIMKAEEWHLDWWNQEWYYLDADGSGHDGWLQEGSVWYYCDNGLMYRNGWFQTGENEYSQFNSSGAWIKSQATMPTE